MSNWLDNSNNANCYKSMYVNGFIDVSGGNIQTRNANNHLVHPAWHFEWKSSRALRYLGHPIIEKKMREHLKRF